MAGVVMPVLRLVLSISFVICGDLLKQGLITVTATATTTTPESDSSQATELSTLKAKVEEMDTKVTTLEKKLKYTRKQLNEATTRLDQLDTQMDSQSGNQSCSCENQCCTVNRISQELTELQGTSSVMEQWVESQKNQTSVEQLENIYSQLNATLMELQARVDELSNSTSNGTTTVTNPVHCKKIRPWVTGVRKIWINSNPREVYCDGEWTVIQKRIDGGVDFYRDWSDYKNGFGNASTEYWIGLDSLVKLTGAGKWELQIDLVNWLDANATALYRGFKVQPESKYYSLTLGSFVSGNAGDSLFATHKQMKFSTKDKDNDRSDSMDCAESFMGAWWYNSCLISNLNGKYYRSSSSRNDGIIWKSWMGFNYSLKKTVMKIRPVAV